MYRIQFSKHFRNVSLRLCNSRSYTTGAIPLKSRHFLSTPDLSVPELKAVLSRSAELKHSVKTRNLLPGLTEFTPGPLSGQTVALMFSKRSTRTRVSTESAIVLLGGHPMFLGKDDIQLGVQPTDRPPDDRLMNLYMTLHG
jgi:ornithine carbamoyltransferase